MNGCLEVALSRMQFGRFPAIDWDRTKREGGRRDKREITHSTKREQREGRAGARSKQRLDERREPLSRVLNKAAMETLEFALLKLSIFLPHQTFHITAPPEVDFGSVQG